jgi:hypothetical protein
VVVVIVVVRKGGSGGEHQGGYRHQRRQQHHLSHSLCSLFLLGSFSRTFGLDSRTGFRRGKRYTP